MRSILQSSGVPSIVATSGSLPGKILSLVVLVHDFSSVSTDCDKLLSGKSSWRRTTDINGMSFFLMAG